MGNSRNSQAVIIILLLILLIGVILGFIWYYATVTNSVIDSGVDRNVTQNQTSQDLVSKDNEVATLKSQLQQKEQEIKSLKDTITKNEKEIEKIKSEDKTTTVIKNEYVILKPENITPKKNWRIDTTVKVPCFTEHEFENDNYTPNVRFKVTTTGKVEVYGDAFEKTTEAYQVKNLTKKVVSLATPHGGQDLTTFCFAIMEDGTLEQIVLRNGEFKSLGTISGVSNVVRVESATYGQGYYPIVVQGNGKAIMLDSDTNKNFTWTLGYWG